MELPRWNEETTGKSIIGGDIRPNAVYDGAGFPIVTKKIAMEN